MRKTGRLAFIFLLLFLLATSATAFHHHNDAGPHYDCPVCIAGHHYSPASVNNFSIEIHQTVSSYEILKVSLLYNSVRYTILPSRAPPV